MPLLDPQNRYARRLNRVVNHVQDNLGESLDLDRLAGVACLSRYHFARVFHDQVGETPMDFVRRVRVERAANLLQNEPDLPVKSIAYQCGIPSQPLFSRSFGARFDCSPRQFRSHRVDSMDGRVGEYRRAFGRLAEVTPDLEEDIDHAAQRIGVVRLKDTPVAYARSIAGYGECVEIEHAFYAMKRWARAQGLLTEDTRPIGVSWDFPGISAEDKCRYDVCIPVPPVSGDVSGVSQQILPGGWYATVRMSYRTPRELLAIWRWFTLTLTCAARFRRFRSDLNLGPWFEKHHGLDENGLLQIELFTRLTVADR